MIRIFTDLFDGDMVLALVFIAAAQAGTEHLREHDDYVGLLSGEFFPDEMRRPISVSALARSLGIPVETTRRHVVKLAKTGFAQRTESGGVIVTSEILRREEIQQAGLHNLECMERLIDGLVHTPRDR